MLASPSAPRRETLAAWALSRPLGSTRIRSRLFGCRPCGGFLGGLRLSHRLAQPVGFLGYERDRRILALYRPTRSDHFFRRLIGCVPRGLLGRFRWYRLGRR